MKMYKGFDEDWTCEGFKFEFGKKYKIDGEIQMCSNGFHCCKNLTDVFKFYDFNENNKFAIVNLSGKVIHGEYGKSVGQEIELIEEITWDNLKKIANLGKDNTGHSNSGDSNSGYRNSGNSNSGYRNSGNRNSGNSNSGYSNSGNSNSGDSNSGYSNSGYRNSGNRNSGNSNSGNSNSGYRNSGYWNSGDSNSGSWNSCDYENGFFNSKKSNYIRVFNKKCKKEIWDSAIKPNFIYDLILNEWVYWSYMTDKEKEDDKDAYLRNGYLKTYSYKEAWENSYNKASKEDIELLKALPNFNAKVFEEITGIKI